MTVNALNGRLWAVAIFMVFCAGECRAQVPPFVGNGAALFAPQIGVVNSGVQNDVQAVVSADRRYVTLTMRPQISTLISLQTFEFQTATPQRGFVGGVMAPAGVGAGGAVVRPASSGPATDPPPATLVLAQTGMTRISPP